jgi:hypothetical protein
MDMASRQTGPARAFVKAIRPVMEGMEERVLLSVPPLSSLPSSSHTLYLDFEGDSAISWNNGDGHGDYQVHGAGTGTPVPAYSYPESISTIWAAVSEKYRPLDINVTTIDPGNIGNGSVEKVVIGGSENDWYLPQSGHSAGGVSSINGFFDPALPNTCYVFGNDAGQAGVGYVADSIAHEAGHAFGLQHQSVWNNGAKIQEYNDNNPLTVNDEFGAAAVAPIMGYSSKADRSVWWFGQNRLNVTIYDLLDLSAGPQNAASNFGYNGLGYQFDDHGNSASTSSLLLRTGNHWSLPITPGSFLGASEIGRQGDEDWFQFTTEAGSVTFTSTVPTTGATLDPILELRDAQGTLLKSADGKYVGKIYSGDTVSQQIAAGTYYICIKGQGVVTASEGKYIDVGSYFLSGSYQSPLDVVSPTAALSSPFNGGTVAQSTINANKYIDVTFSDGGGSGLNLSTITDAEAEFAISGITLNGAPTLVSGTTYRYAFTGTFPLGQVSVIFPFGAWADNAGNQNAATTQTFAVVAKPVITAINPMVLKPLPDVQTQLITISGTGFNAQSTLSFVSAKNNPFSGRVPTYNPSTGDLSYYISVGLTEGQWSVTVRTNGVDSDAAHFNVSSLTPVATPLISPNGGSFSNSVAVSLTSTTSGATIRYTLDGTDPTASSSIYTSALTLSTSATLKARAFKAGLADSAVSSATFNISVTPTAPSITSVSPGLLQPTNNIQQISIYGSGFLPSCLLYFYDPSGNLVQNNQTVFVTSGRVDYGLAVNAKAGTWTVKVVNNPYGTPQPSNSFSFTVAEPSTGNFPTQLSPANGQTGVQQTNPVVSWQPVAGASYYRVFVSTDIASLPRSPTGSAGPGVVILDNPTVTQEILSFYPPGLTLYWQVQAIIGGVNNGWSPIWSFKIAGELNLPPVIQSAAATPNTITQGGTVTFTADGVSDPNLAPDHVIQVEWVRETNGIPGLQTNYPGGDTVLASDDDGSDGWNTTIRIVGVPFGGVDPGTYTMYGVALDSKGAYSAATAPFTFTLLPALVPAPVIQAVVFDPGMPSTLRVVFNTDVSNSLLANKFTLFGPGNPSVKSFSYDAATNMALLSLGTTSPLNGDYQLWIVPTNVYNLAGVTLQGPTTFNFSYMAGDANRDRSVDFNDLVSLAQNYNTSGGKGWAEGDFTGDGNVDFNDLVKLAQNYNTSLDGPALPAGGMSFQDAYAAAFAIAVPKSPSPLKPKPPVAAKPAVVIPARPKPTVVAKASAIVGALKPVSVLKPEPAAVVRAAAPAGLFGVTLIRRSRSVAELLA